MSWIITGTQKNNWDPSLISTALWLDAADVSTITESGGAVSQWDDKSGNNRNVFQSDSARRPAYTLNVLNQKPGIVFDGTNDGLISANGVLQPADLSAFVVARSVTAGKVIMGVSHVATAHITPFFRWVLFHESVPISNGFNIRLDGLSTTSASNVVYTDSHRIYSLSAGDGAAYADGNAVITFASGINTYPNSTPFLIGTNAAGNENLNGSVCEVVITDYTADTLTRQKLEGYLAHKWGLTANLPADHPYKTEVPVP